MLYSVVSGPRIPASPGTRRIVSSTAIRSQYEATLRQSHPDGQLATEWPSRVRFGRGSRADLVGVGLLASGLPLRLFAHHVTVPAIRAAGRDHVSSWALSGWRRLLCSASSWPSQLWGPSRADHPVVATPRPAATAPAGGNPAAAQPVPPEKRRVDRRAAVSRRG